MLLYFAIVKVMNTPQGLNMVEVSKDRFLLMQKSISPKMCKFRIVNFVKIDRFLVISYRISKKARHLEVFMMVSEMSPFLQK